MPRDHATLADLRSPTLTIVCEPCGRRGRYSVARLLAQHGDAKLPDLLETLADSKRARDGGIYDRCKAVYDEASRLHSSPSASRKITSE
jgi:hypothetical protein